jgi:mannosylglycoprotein endo-beta-mannosidase
MLPQAGGPYLSTNLYTSTSQDRTHEKSAPVSLKIIASLSLALSLAANSQTPPQTISGWQMQDIAKVTAPAEQVSTPAYHPDAWYQATVPGTVLTTLVNNGVYPEPLYGENMRSIPESLNKTSYWYRTTVDIPQTKRGQHIWLNFQGINYAADVWINGRNAGTIRGAFIRGLFDITPDVKPGHPATLAVLVHPQPHPGTPHEHTQALGLGQNGGQTAIDGATFLSTIGWDWIPAIRDRDTGIWLPVTLTSTGSSRLGDTYITTDLSPAHDTADIAIKATVKNLESTPANSTLHATLTSPTGHDFTFDQPVQLAPGETKTITFDKSTTPSLHLQQPDLWWPNGYGKQSLYTLHLKLSSGPTLLDQSDLHFGIRKIDYAVADSENLTISVNGVKIMIRGGDWGLDEAMKRIPYQRLDAQFRMHALAHMNMIRNWVGQSTSPDFYDLADKYGILLWDEFFQPNPGDGPNVTDIPIAVWCARNEGYPPKALDDQLKTLMTQLDPARLYQSNSADGRGVSSHGPYFWRSPRFYYSYNESFKTEVGSVSVPTLESIQGMMPKKDWETIDDDWAQHDMASGAQRGNEYPQDLARRYGHIRNLADLARKAQLANYEAFRGMYEGRNAQMFSATTGILTWMIHPAQPSFVWQLYHYDLEPNASLYAVATAAEPLHIQLNEATGAIQVVNNHPEATQPLTVTTTIYDLDGHTWPIKHLAVTPVPASTVISLAHLEIPPHSSRVVFIKLDLRDQTNTLLSTNLYWKDVAQDDLRDLEKLSTAHLQITPTSSIEADETVLTVTLHNPEKFVALMTHLQLHRQSDGQRVLPVFYSQNYISLAPGESRNITIHAKTSDLHASAPVLLVDGYNINVTPVSGPIAVQLNQNAQPANSPATNIVPDEN